MSGFDIRSGSRRARRRVCGRSRRMLVVIAVCLASFGLTPRPASAESVAVCEANWSTLQPPTWLGELQFTGDFFAASYPYMNTWSDTFTPTLSLSLMACREDNYSYADAAGPFYGMYQMISLWPNTYIGPAPGGLNCYLSGCWILGKQTWQQYTAMRRIDSKYGVYGPLAAWNELKATGGWG